MKKRDSKFELLRIFSIFLIIMHHLYRYSCFNYEIMSFENIYISLFGSFGKLGVILFVLITGYFYDKNNISTIKIIKYVIRVSVYSVIGLLIGYIVKSDYLSVFNIIKSFFSIYFGLYWFATCYFILMIFIPYMNILINNLDKEKFKRLLFILLFLNCFIAMIPKTRIYYSDLIQILIIYFMGAYIKKYKFTISRKKTIIAVVILTFIVFGTIISEILLSNKIKLLQDYIMYFTAINSPIIIALAMFIFMCFKNIHLENNYLINIISSSTFGIYLLHDNLFIGEILWERFWKLNELYNVNLVINSILKVLTVFLICSLISLIIENTIIKVMNKIVNILIEDKFEKNS